MSGSNCADLTSGNGMELSGEFKDMLETKGIVPRQKDKDDAHATATLDTAIGNLKKVLARETKGTWHTRLGIEVAGGNQRANLFPARR